MASCRAAINAVAILTVVIDYDPVSRYGVPMFNIRPAIPWIHVRPDQVEDGPPGFRVIADPGRDAPPDDVGFGTFGHSVAARSAPVYPASYPIYNAFDFPLPSRYPTQEVFDQLARIYGIRFGFHEQQDADAGSIGPVDSPPRLPSVNLYSQSNDPLAATGSRIGDGDSIPLSHESPLVQGPLDQFVGNRAGRTLPAKPMAPQSSPFFGTETPSSRLAAVPPATSRQSDANEGQMLSDAASNDGLRDGQQYAQYRPPIAIGGMKVGVDGAGRNVLIPDQSANGEQLDPFEKLKQRGYPKPPEDPGNGSAVVRKLREDNDYGQHRPNYHRFEFKDALCELGTPGCSVEAAYGALLRHALPGGEAPGVPIQHEQVSQVSLKGLVPGGRVQTFLDRDGGSIVHRTMPDHLFRDGYLQRQIVVENGKIYVRTFGEGNNASAEMATANSVMARPAFEDATARIRTALLPPAPSMGEVEWPR